MQANWKRNTSNPEMKCKQTKNLENGPQFFLAVGVEPKASL